MNHYFIAIYDGEFPTEKLHTILQSKHTFTDLNVRTISISLTKTFHIISWRRTRCTYNWTYRQIPLINERVANTQAARKVLLCIRL